MQYNPVIRNSTKTATLAVALLGLALLNGCATDDAASQDGLEAESTLAQRPSNAVIVRWNQVAYDAATVAVYFGPLLFHHDRGFAMMHIAQHDALNAIRPRYQQYAFRGHDTSADPIAAAAQAAHDVMANIYPDQIATFDTELATWLAGVPAGSAKTRGIALGSASAAAIIAQRANDGIDNFGTYTPGTGPGKYQYVPPFDFINQPALMNVPPFGLRAGNQFRSPAPPALNSSKYASAFNEVQSTGALNSTTRTQDQSEYAAFWWELIDAVQNRIARITAAQENLGLWRTARLFALNNIALIDGYIAGWDSKETYDFWRPFTAIHAADTDGNAATTVDPAWQSYQLNPPIQDYPSTHSILGKASSLILTESFCTDHVTFALNSFTALPGKEIRTYSSFAFAANQNADSRVRAGVHFRFSTDEGLSMGTKIGNYLVTHVLLPIGSQSKND